MCLKMRKYSAFISKCLNSDFPLNSIKRSVVTMETGDVYCEVQTESLILFYIKIVLEKTNAVQISTVTDGRPTQK
jgi:hypothetical protein